MDDYISLAIPTSQEQLIHVATEIMMGVHDVFPADSNDDDVPLSLKELKHWRPCGRYIRTFLVLPLPVLRKLSGSSSQNMMLYLLSSTDELE